MIETLLYQVQIRALSKTRVEITLVPTWLGRWFKRRVRQGIAYRAKDNEDVICWWWQATDRYVGGHVERYIEAVPVLTIEDMTVEQLLLGDSSASDNVPRSEPRRSKKVP